MFNFFKRKKRVIVSVILALDCPYYECMIWLKVNGHEGEVAAAFLLAMDLDPSFAKMVRQAVALYLDPEREITEFKTKSR